MPHLIKEVEQVEKKGKKLPDKLPIQFVTYGEYIIIGGNWRARLRKAWEVFWSGRFLVQFRKPTELPVVKQDSPLGVEYISEDYKGRAIDY